MDKKKWFIDQNGGLLDLNNYDEYEIDFKAGETNQFRVLAGTDGDSLKALGNFETKQEAKDYIKKIYDFIIAE